MSKIYFRKKLLLAKLEVTHGTDSVPTGAANAIQTKDLTISPIESTVLDLGLDKPNFGSNLGTLLGQHVMITFKVPVAGSGAAGTAPAWAPLVKACAFQETVAAGVSVTYAPLDDDPPSLSMYVNVDGVLHKITYARGSFKTTTDNKNYPWFEFTFLGLFTTPIAGAMPVPVFTPWIKPLPFRAPTVVGSVIGIAVPMFSLTIDAGQKVEYYETSEEQSVQITDRTATFQTEFEEPDIATHNYYADIVAETTGALSYVHGVTAGNIVTFSGAASQITKVTRGNQQGVATLQVSGPLVYSGATPDLTIVAT